jgi:hypothetical protein
MECAINLLSNDELNAAAGGMMNTYSDINAYISDPSGDKLPWNPTFNPHGGPLGPQPKHK